MKAQDIYGEPRVIKFADGGIAKVYSPILTPEERARRMRIIHDAAADLLKSKMR